MDLGAQTSIEIDHGRAECRIALSRAAERLPKSWIATKNLASNLSHGGAERG
jgi:hypothetical protein